jgi:hypothetical protein
MRMSTSNSYIRGPSGAEAIRIITEKKGTGQRIRSGNFLPDPLKN